MNCALFFMRETFRGVAPAPGMPALFGSKEGQKSMASGVCEGSKTEGSMSGLRVKVDGSRGVQRVKRSPLQECAKGQKSMAPGVCEGSKAIAPGCVQWRKCDGAEGVFGQCRVKQQGVLDTQKDPVACYRIRGLLAHSAIGKGG